MHTFLNALIKSYSSHYKLIYIYKQNIDIRLCLKLFNYYLKHFSIYIINRFKDIRTHH